MTLSPPIERELDPAATTREAGAVSAPSVTSGFPVPDALTGQVTLARGEGVPDVSPGVSVRATASPAPVDAGAPAPVSTGLPALPPGVSVSAASLTAALSPDAEVAARQMTEALRRFAIVQRAEAIAFAAANDQRPLPSGPTLAAIIGEPATTLWRWLRDYRAQGFIGLVPRWHAAGRTSEAEKLRRLLGVEVYDQVIGILRGTAADTQAVTSGIRYGSKMRLVEQLTPTIGDDRARWVAEQVVLVVDRTSRGTARRSKHSIAPSIRREVAAATDPNQRLAHRGPRALAIKGMYLPRTIEELLPGDIYTSDDTTPIWAWWVPVPWAKGNSLFEQASCEYRFGEMLLQGQFLPFMDVAAQAVLSFALIARATAGYRAADIWGAMGHLFDTYGLPRLGVQFERGSWEAKLIEGEDVEFADGEITLERRVGGLRMLPTNVTDWHRAKWGVDRAESLPRTLQTFKSFSPNSKSIEALFDRLQTFEGTIWGVLGRDQMRKPFEKMKKLYEACRRGAAQPSLHFLSGLEMTDRVAKLANFVNHEPLEGRVFRGIPAETWARANEWPTLRLPEGERHLYRRHWTTGTIRRGMVAFSFTAPDGRRARLFYTNPAEFGQPGMEDRRVIIYFDAASPETPAQIHDAGGAFLCEAEHVQPFSMIDGELTGHDLRKLWRETVMTFHRSVIMPNAPSRQVPPEITARRAAARTETTVTTTVTTAGATAAGTSPRGSGETAATPPGEGEGSLIRRLLGGGDE